MTPADIVTSALALIGLVGGAIGFFVARAARRDASSAEARSIEALSRSAAAHEESAQALKRANELAEMQLPKPKAKIDISHVGGGRWIARNVGEITAYALEVLPASDDLVGFITPEEDGPRDLSRGDGVTFFVFEAMGSPPPRIRVRYEERRVEGTQAFENIVLIPT